MNIPERVYLLKAEEYFDGSFVLYGEKGEMPKFNAHRKYVLVVDYSHSTYPTIWANPVH